jgi:AraC-like DNA-binding protein
VLPDACVDIVWRRGRLLVVGPDRESFMSPVEPGETIVGLRLRPGSAGRVLALPAGEIRSTRVSLEDVWDGRLAERLGEAGGDEHRRALLEDAVGARLPGMADPDRLVLAAIRQLGRPGSLVRSLSRDLGTSERQLLRRFNAAVGYGPKTLDRVLRFQRFRRKALAGVDLARLATELGYADQAHLTRECVRLSGLTPMRLAARGAARV